MPSDDGSFVPPQARARSPTPLDFMQCPHPDATSTRILTHLEALPSVKEETERCVVNLLNYRAVRTGARLPRGPSAAVLVPLFVGRSGDLYVVLSRRSEALRSFAGDTALPGGKIDAQDATVEDTARREAFEEIGLPRDKERVPLLCVLEPHLAKGEMLVTPVVVLIVDYSLQVTLIFAQLLISFLSSTPYLPGGRTADPSNPYHTFVDFPWGASGAIRLHKFLTGREGEGVKPVFGLTAAILIRTATIGYGRTPEFEVQPPNAPTPVQQIARALLNPMNPLRIACDQEGVDAGETATWLLRLSAGTDEREKGGVGWKKLGGTADASARVNAAVGKGKGSGSRQAPGDVQKCIEEIRERPIQYRVHHVDDGSYDSNVGKGEDDHDPGLVLSRKRDGKL